MALRWRADGTLVCAAKSDPEEGDTYLDDRVHYQLSVVSRAVLPAWDEDSTGRWMWVHDEGPTPLGVARDEV